MNKQILRSLVMAASLSAALVGTASADQMWNFDSLLSNSQHNTSLGASYTFTQGSAWMQATALVHPTWTESACSGTTSNPCLYAKFTSGDAAESGLGLKPAAQNEVNFPDGIGLMTSAGSHISSITIGSVQSDESWAVVGCSATFASCAPIDQGVGGGTNEVLTINGLSKDDYSSFVVYVPCKDGTKCDNSGTTNYSNNILLLSATTVPEPGVLALFGAGLFGCALAMRRRRRASELQA
jgi:hypothetical protein